jgi:hypothetical protein
MEPLANGEREFNDTLAQAEEIEAGSVRRGHIGWEGDRDVYCLLDAGGDVRVELSGIEELNLKLSRFSRDGTRRAVIDEGGLGEGERIERISVDGAPDICLEVTMEPVEFGARMSGTPYELSIVEDSEASSSREMD